MDFIGGALPNVMFLIGVIAIGIGFGLEFKIVEVKGQLSRSGRIGVITSGILLITASVFLYIRPESTTAASGTTPPPVSQANALAVAPVGDAPTVAVATALAPTATPLPPTATPLPPTATPLLPTATPPAPTAPSVAANIAVLDIRGLKREEAAQQLANQGLQLGEQQQNCEAIGARRDNGKPKKDRVLCQAPAPDTNVAPGTTISYVLFNGDDDDDD